MSWNASAWADAQALQPPPECILVLAGGVDDDGRVHASVARRLDAAAELYRRSVLKGEPCAIIANGGGTAHKPRWRDAAGFAVPEAELMAAELRARGVPLLAVVLESLSDDTLGNAYAARALHTEWRTDWRRLVLITSDFQMPRAEAAYRWLFGLAPAPPGGRQYELRCCAVPDDGALDGDALAARLAREAASLASFRAGVGARITTMAQAQAWLFGEHSAYAPRAKPREPVDAALLKTY